MSREAANQGRAVSGKGHGITYTRKLEDFSGKILQHCRHVDCCFSANAHLVLRVLLEESLDTTAWELRKDLLLAWYNNDI